MKRKKTNREKWYILKIEMPYKMQGAGNLSKSSEILYSIIAVKVSICALVKRNNLKCTHLFVWTVTL